MVAFGSTAVALGGRVRYPESAGFGKHEANYPPENDATVLRGQLLERDANTGVVNDGAQIVSLRKFLNCRPPLVCTVSLVRPDAIKFVLENYAELVRGNARFDML